MENFNSNREFSALSRNTRRDIESTMQQTHADFRFRQLNTRYLIIRKTKSALFFHHPSIEYQSTGLPSCLVHVFKTKKGAVKQCLLQVRFGATYKNPGWTPFWVENEHMYVGYESLDVATHFARAVFTRREYINTTFLQQQIESYYEPTVQMEVDVKYMEAAGVPIHQDQVEVPFVEMQRFEETKVDSQLYDKFSAVLKQLLKERSMKPTLMRSMGNTRVLSKVSSPVNATVHFHENKRELTPQQWLEASKGKAPTIAFQFPKPGSITSSGNARTVVTLDPYLEAFNRRFWDGVSYANLRGYCSRPSDVRSDLKHSYDIRSADLLVGPYFRKFCEEEYPHQEDGLMPLVVGKYGPYRTQALPSGVPHTAIVINAFAYSLCQHLGLDDYQFQGDGILTNVELQSPYLRNNEDHVLNGFRKIDGVTQYVNTSRLAATQYLRPQKANGELRYRIRYSCLHILCAKDLDCYPKPRRGLLTADQIREICLPSSLTYLESLAVGHNYTYSTANCESTVRSECTGCTRFYGAPFEICTC